MKFGRGFDQLTAWLLACFLVGGMAIGVYALLQASFKQTTKEEIRDRSKERIFADAKILDRLTEERLAEEQEDDEEEDSEEEDASFDLEKFEKAAMWTYQGAQGPESWGSINDIYRACSRGHKQSPINIEDAMVQTDLKPLKFYYTQVIVNTLNDSHALVVKFEGGNYLVFRGERFDLMQIIWHQPSEHKVNGSSFDMEMELVHQNEEHKQLILSLFMQEGSVNNELAKIWHHLPKEAGSEGAAANFDVTRLLPRESNYYYYEGSLTRPPCSEGVMRLLMVQPVRISSAQVDSFLQLFKRNIRPLQARNHRKVKLSVSK